MDHDLEQLNRSALRAAELLIAAGEHPGGASAAVLAEQTDIPRPTAFRILLSLAHTGLLSREGGNFRLGWRTGALGRLADPWRDLAPRLQPFLDELANTFNESVEFVMFTSNSTQETIAQASGSRLLAPSHQYVGRSFPLHASATGKVLLAEQDTAALAAALPLELEALTENTVTSRPVLLEQLQEIKKAGFAVLDGELEEGLYVIAVPVRNGSGEVVASLSVSGLSLRMTKSGVDYVNRLQHAAAKLAVLVESGT